MTAVSPDPYVELRFNPTDLRPQDIPRAGTFLGSPAEALEAALSVVRTRVVEQAKAEIAGIANPTYSQLLRIADLAWQAVFWKYRKISAPVLADAYVRAYRKADAGDVPTSVIYDLAEKHAEKTGEYFHSSSSEALGEGFNSLVNRNIPAKAAADRVLDAYGLTPRQMRGYTSAKFDAPVTDILTREPKAQARAYIDKSFTSRIRKLSEQEEHNIEQQAQQLAWMWLQDKGKLGERAEKMWLTAKDERVCPICGPLHGKKVPITAQFVTKEGAFWTPGLHPNCRCELRLIENKYQLEKRFDPHQPRGHDGRWSGGRSSSRQLSDKLNRMESPSAKVKTGNIHRIQQASGYLTQPRYLTTPLKHRDKEMAQVARGASAWSRRSALVTRTREMADPDNAYYASKMKLSGTERSLKSLITAVQSAPASSPELYRGLVVTPDHLSELKPGSTFDLPMSSFTEDKAFSESFARKWGPMIARSHAKRAGQTAPSHTHPVVFVLEPKAQALNISPLVSERQAEWISQGSFTITQVSDDDGLTVVHLRQERSKVSKADEWNPKLHPRGGDPKNRGRFSRTRKLAYPDRPTESITNLNRFLAEAEALHAREEEKVKAPEKIGLGGALISAGEKIGIPAKIGLDRKISAAETAGDLGTEISAERPRISAEEIAEQIKLTPAAKLKLVAQTEKILAEEQAGYVAPTIPEKKLYYKPTIWLHDATNKQRPYYALVEETTNTDGSYYNLGHDTHFVPNLYSLATDVVERREDKIRDAIDQVVNDVAEDPVLWHPVEGSQFSADLDVADLEGPIRWLANGSRPEEDFPQEVTWVDRSGGLHEQSHKYSEIIEMMGYRAKHLDLEVKVMRLDEAHDSWKGQTVHHRAGTFQGKEHWATSGLYTVKKTTKKVVHSEPGFKVGTTIVSLDPDVEEVELPAFGMKQGE